MKKSYNPLSFVITVGIILFSFSSYAAGQIKTEELFKRSDVIWGFDFLNENEIVFTERDGKIFHYNQTTKKTTQLEAPKDIYSRGQGGLLDVLVHRMDETTYLYLTYADSSNEAGATTSLGRGEFKNGKLENFQKIFQAKASGSKNIHFGSRLVFDKEGFLFMTVGDRGERDKAQELNSHNGSVLRLTALGKPAPKNPLLENKDALPEIYSYGHRNPQGIALNPSNNQIWSVEFGPRGGDEVNHVRPGKNYGWPVITYGKEYWGPKIGEGTEKEGMEQPLKYFVPAISPSGMAFYTGDKFPQWRGHLFLAALSETHLHRLEFKDNKVVSQERLLENLGERIRMVRTSPDGFLYISTDSGKILKISPSAP